MQDADAVRKQERRRIVRVGHRGAAGHAPENTLAAVRKGIELGADFIEVDVRRTRDGRLVLMHDPLVDRTTNGSGLLSEISWDELQAFDAGNGERVPSVEAALEAASGHAGIMLEIKTPGVGPDLHRLVQNSGFPGPVVYASFLHAEVFEIRRLDPHAQTMALMECIPVSGAAFARDANATMVGLAHDFAMAEFISTLHHAALKVWLYTLNDPRLIRRALTLAPDGLISDFPDRVPASRG